jgi:hypothetical protein
MKRHWQTLIALLIVALPVGASYLIPPNSVVTSSIASGAVTQVKLAPLPEITPAPSASPGVGVGSVGVSASSGNYTMASGTPAQATNLAVSVYTDGLRPISIGLMSDGSGTSDCTWGVVNSSGASASARAYFKRGSTVIGTYNLEPIATGATFTALEIPCSSLSMNDFPSAGTYTYSVYVSLTTGTSALLAYAVMVVREL